MHIETITTPEGLNALEVEWRELVPRTAADTVFLTWEWISSWWASYGGDKKLLVLVARDSDGSCQGIAPLCVETHRRMGQVMRRLRFLGDGSADSDYLDFLVPRGGETEVLPTLLDHLRSLDDAWDVAQLNEIPDSSPTAAVLTNWLASSGWLCRRDNVPCALVALPRSWDGYERMLRPRFRTAVRACVRDLQQWGGTVERLKEEAQLEGWLDQLFSLHAGRWQRRGQQGVFRDPAKRDFYRRICRAFLKHDWLHFTRLRVNGAVLACQFGFVYQLRYYQLQEGFDLECAHVSPGISLRAAMIRDLIDKGFREYDFLGGIGRHKTDWGATVKSSWRCAFAPRTAVGLSYIKLPQFVEVGKQQIKSVLPDGVLKWWHSARGRPEGGKTEASPKVGNGNDQRANWREPIATALHGSGLLRTARRLSRSYELQATPRGRWPQWRQVSNPKFVILSYHRVGSGGIPFYSSLAPKLFEAQMRFLRKHYRIVSLDEIVAELKDPGKRDQGVAITFDDGYRDTYSVAFPILERYKIPATVFLTVHSIETGQVSWYDRVFLAFQILPSDKLDIFLDRPRRFRLSNSALRLQGAVDFVGYIRALPDSRRKECCATLEKIVRLPERELTGRMLTWEQVRVMQRAGISFGSHTLTHPVVSQLGPVDLEREMLQSKQILEHELDRPVKDFAFPFGKPNDCGSAARDVLLRYGYRSAATTILGVNTPGMDLLALRRSSMGEESSVAMFAFNLNQLFLHTKDQLDAGLIARVAAKTDSVHGSERLAN